MKTMRSSDMLSDFSLDLLQVELKMRKTCFWRHQKGKPDSYLATIEAIYYFLRDYHKYCLGQEYDGEYDNLLFFYSFLHSVVNKAKTERKTWNQLQNPISIWKLEKVATVSLAMTDLSMAHCCLSPTDYWDRLLHHQWFGINWMMDPTNTDSGYRFMLYSVTDGW